MVIYGFAILRMTEEYKSRSVSRFAACIYVKFSLWELLLCVSFVTHKQYTNNANVTNSVLECNTIHTSHK